MTGPKLNEAPVRRKSGLRPQKPQEGTLGTKAVARYVRTSPYKVREVLDLIRGQDVARAREILRFSERDAAIVVAKVLNSAVANAENNDSLPEDELYVSACFADEGPTLKRWRPRARGRATRIRKRTCHITVLVARIPDAELARRRAAAPSGGRAARRAGQQAAERRRRGRQQEVAPAADAALASEPEEAQVEAANAVAEAGAEEATTEAADVAVTTEQVVAEEDATGATQETAAEATEEEK